MKTTKETHGLWKLVKSIIDPAWMNSEDCGPHTISARWKQIRDLILELRVDQIMSALTRTGMGYHWRASSERILFLEKRTTRHRWPDEPAGLGRRLNDLGEKDTLYAAPVLGNGAYPTEKPVGLIMQLIANSSERGELVVDPFAGSGATGRAAYCLERRFLMGDTSGFSIETMLRHFQEMMEP